MPKAAKVKIIGPVYGEACRETKKTEYVAEVQIGRFFYPMYIGPGPLWDEIGGQEQVTNAVPQRSRSSNASKREPVNGVSPDRQG